MGKGAQRNKPCPCGSGKKYKNCCYGRTSAFRDLELGKTVKNLFKELKPKKCYFSHDGKCSNKVIKAHSIQNNRILKKISKNGYVVMLGFDYKNFNPLDPGIRMIEQGRKTATTFTGFCSYHDQMLFKDIDNKDYSEFNGKQRFLFCFRGLVFEFYKKEMARSVFEEARNSGFIKNKELADLFLTGTRKSIKDLNYYFTLFKKSLETDNYNILESVHLILNREYPLAVNSLFGLEYDMNGEMINDLSDLSKRLKVVFLNIFPQGGKTYAIISWLKKDGDAFSNFKEQISSIHKENEKLSLLNNLIFSYTENFALNPELLNKFSTEEKRIFEITFGWSAEMSVPKNALSISPPFNLFRKI